MEVRDKVIYSAVEVLGGDFDATLEQIANHGGISRRTLHRYFSNREELIVEVFNHIGNEYIESVLGIIWDDGEAEEKLEQLLRHDIGMCLKYLTFHGIYERYKDEYEFEPEIMGKIQNAYDKIFLEVLGGDNATSKIDVKWAGLFYISIMETAAKACEEGVTVDECKEIACHLFWNGIRKS